MRGHTFLTVSPGREREVWIMSAARTPLGAHGGALYEVQPASLLAGLIEAIRTRSSVQGPTAWPLSALIVGAAAQGSIAASSLHAALARANSSVSVSTTQLEGGSESGAEAIRLAAAQIRAGDAQLVLAGAIHLPSRGREQRRANPDVLGALAAHLVSPRVAADAAVALQGITTEDVATYIESGRNAGVPTVFADAVDPVVDLNGLIILGSDDVGANTVGADANANEVWQAHHALARKARPQLGDFPRVHSPQTDAPALEGASLMLLGSSDAAAGLGLRTRARVVACAAAGHSRLLAVEAAELAFGKVLERAGWRRETLDLVEVSSRFAGVPLAIARALGLDASRMNINRSDWWHANAGAVSPVIALSNLVHGLEHAGLRRGALVAVGDAGCNVIILVDRGNDD